jgi:hypothetical protein
MHASAYLKSIAQISHQFCHVVTLANMLQFREGWLRLGPWMQVLGRTFEVAGL